MRIICAGFYEIISDIITTLGRISPWSETPQPLEKSNILPRAMSSPSRKPAACIIGIDEPPNFGAAAGPREKSTRIDRRRIASKVLACVSTNLALAEQNTNCEFEVEIGFGATNLSCLPS
jgi:hypothetical protein